MQGVVVLTPIGEHALICAEPYNVQLLAASSLFQLPGSSRGSIKEAGLNR